MKKNCNIEIQETKLQDLSGDSVPALENTSKNTGNPEFCDDPPRLNEALLPEVAYLSEQIDDDYDGNIGNFFDFGDVMARFFIQHWIDYLNAEQKKLNKQNAMKKTRKKTEGQNLMVLSRLNEIKATSFVLRFTTSSPTALSIYMDYKDSSYSSKKMLHDDELQKLSRTERKALENDDRYLFYGTPIPTDKKGRPKVLLTLTPAGIKAAKRDPENEGLDYPVLTYGQRLKLANSKTIWHDTFTQYLTIAAMQWNQQIIYTHESHYGKLNKGKKPDVIWEVPLDDRLFEYLLAIESELSSKSGAALYQWIKGIYDALINNEYHYFVLFTDDPYIYEMYGRYLKGKEGLQVYENGKKVPGRKLKFGFPLCNRVHLVFVNDAKNPESEVKSFLNSFMSSHRGCNTPLNQMTTDDWIEECTNHAIDDDDDEEFI